MAGTDTSLQRLLEKAKSSGVLESTSDFTINTLKARRKLGESQLPQNGLWLVKLVQSAVSCNATRAEITFGKRAVGFQFETNNWPCAPGEVFHQLLSGLLPSDPTLFHLFAGLRHSLFDDTVRAEWAICTGDRLFRAEFHEEGTEVSEQEGDGKPGFRLTTSRPPRWPGFRRAAHLPVKHLIRRTAEEFFAVNSYCWPCPVPLLVDGRPLESRYIPSSTVDEERFLQHAVGAGHFNTYKVTPIVLVKRSLSGDPELIIPWEEDAGESRDVEHEGRRLTLKKRAYFGQTWMQWRLPPEETPGGYLLLLFGALMESRIEFLCDGVVVDTHPLSWSSKNVKVLGHEIPLNQFKVGVRVLLPVSPSQLDLSHFRVRQKDELAKHWEPRIREILEETAEAVLRYAKEFQPELIHEPTNAVGRAIGGYLRFLTSVHPVLYYLKTYGFRKELKTLLESIRETE